MVSRELLAAVRAAAKQPGGTQRSYIVRALAKPKHRRIGVIDRYLLSVAAYELGLYAESVTLIDGAVASGLAGGHRERADQLRDVCAAKTGGR